MRARCHCTSQSFSSGSKLSTVFSLPSSASAASVSETRIPTERRRQSTAAAQNKRNSDNTVVYNKFSCCCCCCCCWLFGSLSWFSTFLSMFSSWRFSFFPLLCPYLCPCHTWFLWHSLCGHNAHLIENGVTTKQPGTALPPPTPHAHTCCESCEAAAATIDEHLVNISITNSCRSFAGQCSWLAGEKNMASPAARCARVAASRFWLL